MIQRLGGH